MKLKPESALSSPDLFKMADGLQKADDATLVIVTTSWIDDALKELFRRRMLPRKEDQDSLLMPDRPLGSFAAKIKLAFMLGWLPPDLNQELKDLKDIRNGFAHSRDKLSLSKSPLREKCNELQIPTAYNAGGPLRRVRSSRQRFLIAAVFATRGILTLAERSKSPPEPPKDLEVTPFLMAIRREIKSATLRQVVAALPDL